MRKKVDNRIRTLVENCVKQSQRSLFVIVGDKGRDQVVNLHYMLSKTVVKARPSVLWCYKKELYLSRLAQMGFALSCASSAQIKLLMLTGQFLLSNKLFGILVTRKSVCGKLRKWHSEDCWIQSRRTLSPCLWPPLISDIAITMTRTRFWEIHLACVFFR